MNLEGTEITLLPEDRKQLHEFDRFVHGYRMARILTRIYSFAIKT